MSNKPITKRSRWWMSLTLGGLLVAGVGLAAIVQADPGPRHKMDRRCDTNRSGGHDVVGHALRGMIRSGEVLGLSADQESKIKAIALAHQKSRIQGEANVRLAELDVRTGLFNEKVELATLESALQKSESARTSMRLEGVKSLRAATAVLTPEQREKWRHQVMSGHKGGAGRKGYGRGPIEDRHDRPERQG